MKTLRAAIIGCNNIYETHAAVLEGLEGVEVTAVCDIREDRAQRAAARFGCRCYTDAAEVMADPQVDTVHLCVPHYLHAPMTVAALQAGKAVICEKPMATSLDDARAMLAAEQAHPNKLCIIFQNRYNDASEKMKALLDEGRYGKLLAIRGLVDWKRDMQYYSDDWHGRLATEGGGVMMNQAIHTLDLVQWMAGSPVTSVSGQIGNLSLQGKIEVEDTATLRLCFENGLIGLFQASIGYGIDSDVEVEAVCEQGTLLLKKDRLYLNRQGEMTLIQGPLISHVAGKDYWGDGHQRQLADVYACLREDRPIRIDGRTGFTAFAIVQALYRSAEQGGAAVAVAQA